MILTDLVRILTATAIHLAFTPVRALAYWTDAALYMEGEV